MCNILSVILRANFADPVDTANDIIERNITLFGWPGGVMWKQWLAQHDNPDYNKLAETMIIPDTWKEYDKMIEHGILANRTHVQMISYVSPGGISLGRHPGLSDRMTHKGAEVWYKSKERVDNFPYGGYLSRKEWRFNEVEFYSNLSAIRVIFVILTGNDGDFASLCTGTTVYSA